MSDTTTVMGELIKIIDFLEKKHFAQYLWAYERTQYIPSNTITYIESLEDCHGYSIL